MLEGVRGEEAAVQRQAPAPAPAPAPGVTPPSGHGPAPQLLPDFGNTTFLHGGPRFDLRYEPVGPSPAVGKVTAILKVHVIFKPFERAMMRRKEFVRHRWSREQLNDFAWPEDQQQQWVGRFSNAVSDGWKEKHAFVLNEAGFAPHRATCDVQVRHVDTPEEANTIITAQWVPRGAPRLRSSVTGGAAELDARDVDQPETHRVRPAQLIRQIPGFGHDSAEINPAVEAHILDFEDRFRQLRQPGRPFDVPVDDISVGVTGRATSPGSQRYNRDLGMRRASAVQDRLMDDLGLSMAIGIGTGETNASDDPKFRRVDVAATVGEEREVAQNVAAHEAGHMFGLGDEYVDERPPTGAVPKFAGDEPTHAGDIRATLGDEAADALLVQNGPSIMSQGSEVRPGHYVPFLQALNRVTSKTWSLE
ncbi:MAG TPA: hypothetical protein VM324_12155 [Egibacteraceae bacterium]|nr:hypothetical protein [Egibacteraceae bacterium]